MARKKEPKYKKEDLIKLLVEWSISGTHVVKMKKDFIKLGYGDTYFYQIYNEAKPLIMDVLKSVAKDRLEETIMVMEKEYDDAINNKDKRLANDIRKEINKISGLHNQQQKLDITTNGQSININYIKPNKPDNAD